MQIKLIKMESTMFKNKIHFIGLQQQITWGKSIADILTIESIQNKTKKWKKKNKTKRNKASIVGQFQETKYICGKL